MPTRPHPIDKYEGLRGRLGKHTDATLAKSYGLSRALIGRYRNDLGIPPFTTPAAPTYVVTWRNRLWEWLVERWKAGDARDLKDLADIRADPTRVGAWSTGAGGRRPSLDALVGLADACGYHLVLRPRRVWLKARADRWVVSRLTQERKLHTVDLGEDESLG